MKQLLRPLLILATLALVPLAVSAPADAAAATGSVQVTVTGLPKGVKAGIVFSSVKAPGKKTSGKNVRRTLNATTNVTKLRPGTYRVTPKNVIANGVTYLALSPSKTFKVRANKRAKV